MPPTHHQGSGFPAPLTPQSSYTSGPTASLGQYASPQQHGGYGQPLPSARMTHPQQAGYNAPRPIEVWHLPDAANASIPDDVRERYQCDAQGRVLLFTAPPIAESTEKKGLAHTAKYLAYKIKREEMLREKRERDAEDAVIQSGARKRAKSEEQREAQKKFAEAQRVALMTVEDALADATIHEYERLYGAQWRPKMEEELQMLEKKQVEEARRRDEREKLEAGWKSREKKKLAILGLGPNLEFTAE
jgi:chromatin structure-remodeling complex subunit RSC1/2